MPSSARSARSYSERATCQRETRRGVLPPVKVSLSDIKALRQRHGGSMRDAKRALESAGGDLELAGRMFAAIVRGQERSATQSNEGVDFAALETQLKQAIEACETPTELRRRWREGLLDPLLGLLDGPELRALIDGLSATLEQAWPTFERPAEGQWAEWFLAGAPDSRLDLFRCLELSHCDDRDQLIDGLFYLDPLGGAIEQLHLPLVDETVLTTLAERELPALRSLRFVPSDNTGLTALRGAAWLARIEALSVSNFAMRGPDMLEPLAGATQLQRLRAGARYPDGLVLPPLAKLTQLALERGDLSDLQGLPASLETLSLRGSVFTKKVVEAVAASSTTTLELDGCGTLEGEVLHQDPDLIDIYNDVRSGRTRKRPAKLTLSAIGAQIVQTSIL